MDSDEVLKDKVQSTLHKVIVQTRCVCLLLFYFYVFIFLGGGVLFVPFNIENVNILSYCSMEAFVVVLIRGDSQYVSRDT